MVVEFDVDRSGNFLGMPEESLVDVMNNVSTNMGINIARADKTLKSKMESYVENGVRDLWIGLYDQWAEYKNHREYPDKLQEIRERDNIAVQERQHQGRHDIRCFYVEKDIDPVAMRAHLEQRLQADGDFHERCRALGREHPNIRSINRVLERDNELKAPEQQA